MANVEIAFIISQLKETYDGDPWYGKSITTVLDELPESVVYHPNEKGHSILELLWHMITWREFTVDRLQHSPQMQMSYFEKNDWRELDAQDDTLWPEGMERLKETQSQLLYLLSEKDDAFLEREVREKNYNFRKLLNGIIQHDVYHLGQIVAIKKMVMGE